MSLLFWRNSKDRQSVEVGDENPLPVDVSSPIVEAVAISTGMEQVTVGATAVVLTATKYQGSATRADVFVETAPIRVRWDGGTPTTSVGVLLNPGDYFPLHTIGEISNFQAIATTSTSGAVTVVYGNGAPLAQRMPIRRGNTTNSAGGAIVDQRTTEPWDDGPATHYAALYPGSIAYTPSGTSVTSNLLAANTAGNAYLSPNSPPAGLEVQGFPSMVDVRHIRLFIDNSGTSANITAVQISSAKTTGSTTETITYSPTSFANIASGSSAVVHIPTPGGLNLAVNVVITQTASAGTVTIQPILYTQPIMTGTKVDRSGTTSGTPSTSTTLMSGNTARRGFEVQNTDNVDMWINFTTAAAATQPSLRIVPGAYYREELPEFVSTELITVLSTVASKTYTAKEW